MARSLTIESKPDPSTPANQRPFARPRSTSAGLAGGCRRSTARHRVVHGQPERAGDVVAGAGRDDAERVVGAGDALAAPRLTRPSPPTATSAVDPRGHPVAEPVERLVGVAADDHVDVDAAAAQPVGHRVEQPGPPRPLPDVGLTSRATRRVTAEG